MSATAKIFKHGGSQAVRLPREFRFSRDEVSIRRVPGGVLLSTPESRVAALHDAYAAIDARYDPENVFPEPADPATDDPVSFDD